jgi:hypothetical protein
VEGKIGIALVQEWAVIFAGGHATNLDTIEKNSDYFPKQHYQVIFIIGTHCVSCEVGNEF